MLANVALAFSLWCVVSGSVLKGNVEDETVEDAVLIRSNRACVNSQCNQICQWLGFARGVCEGNDCYCYWSKSSKDAPESKAPSFDVKVKDVPVNPEGLKDGFLVKSSRACDDSGCNALCQWLGFAWGQCYGNDCYCYWAKSSSVDAPKSQASSFDADVAISELDKLESLEDGMLVKSAVASRACVNSQCNQICQWLGFARGVCQGNDCYCYWAKSQSIDALESGNRPE